MSSDSLLDIFVDEANEILAGLEPIFSARDASEKEISARLLQDLHTLKGGAKMVGQNEISDVTHQLEQFIQSLKDNALLQNRAVIESALTALKNMVVAVANNLPIPQTADLMQAIMPPAPPKKTPQLSEKSIKLLHQESINLCRQLRSHLNNLTEDDNNAADLKNIRETLVSFKGCALMGDYPELANYCISAIAAVELLLENKVLMHKKIMHELHGVYNVLMDTLEYLITHRKVNSFPDAYVNISEAVDAVDNKHHAQSLNDNVQEYIRVGTSSLDMLGNLAEMINVGRSHLADDINNMIKASSSTLKDIKVANEIVRILELQSDSVVNYIQNDRIKEQLEFDELEFDQYSQFGQNTRQLCSYLHQIKTDFQGFYEHAKELQQNLHVYAHTAQQLEEELTHIRMVSFKSFLPRLQTMLRGVSHELGKQVDFICKNADYEVDRNLLQKIMPALEHLLRNAIDHGIEPEPERLLQNKKSAGQITLSLEYTGRYLVISLQDDGKGLNEDKILNIAQEKNLISNEQNLTTKEIHQLIFAPGFSTSAAVTQISGRGVGMDVVNAIIHNLGGSISIESSANQGTTFVLRIPIMMSLNKVLLMGVQSNYFAIALSAVVGIARIPLSQMQRGQGKVQYSGNAYPCYALKSVLGLKVEQHIQPFLPVVLVQAGSQVIGFAVDTILDHREIVIKPLAKHLQGVHDCVGVANIGEGKIALVLAEDKLIERLALPLQDEVLDTISNINKVLVVDDSLTVRKVTETFLTRHQFKVQTAQDGLDALEQLATYMPDVILLDIEMPRMDGYQFLTQLRSKEKYTTIPVIVITSRSQDKHREKAMHLGASAYLTKPYSEEHLLEMIKEVTKEDERKQSY